MLGLAGLVRSKRREYSRTAVCAFEGGGELLHGSSVTRGATLFKPDLRRFVRRKANPLIIRRSCSSTQNLIRREDRLSVLGR